MVSMQALDISTSVGFASSETYACPLLHNYTAPSRDLTAPARVLTRGDFHTNLRYITAPARVLTRGFTAALNTNY